MTTLKNINFGLNQYCGPSVLSALTGKSTDECAAVIQAISGAREIKAVNVNHLLSALKKLRFIAEKQIPKMGSLYGNLTVIESGLYLIIVPKHVVVVEKVDNIIYLIDNHTKEAINAASFARLMQRVDDIYKVVAKPQPIFIRDEISVKHSYSTQYQIIRDSIHEDPEDNVRAFIGSLYIRDKDELNKIIEELQKVL